MPPISSPGERVLGFGVEKFMAFDKTAWIDLRPITLLFGANSHGKSAIIRALLLLRQSLDSGTRDEPLAFIVEDGVDMGDFESVIHKNQLQERITFHFRCRLLNTIDGLRSSIGDVLHRKKQAVPSSFFDDEDVAEFSFSFGWDKKSKKVVLVGFCVHCPWKMFQGKQGCTLLEAERYLEMMDHGQDEHKEFQPNNEEKSWQEIPPKQENSWTWSEN